MDKVTKEVRSNNMSRIKSKDSHIEVVLRHALWNSGIRYRKNFKKLPGKPDIVITKHKLAIFCDSEFWHGKDFTEETFSGTERREFWTEKIKRNIDRDNEVNHQLNDLGYKVVRFWGKEILSDINRCVMIIRGLMIE